MCNRCETDTKFKKNLNRCQIQKTLKQMRNRCQIQNSNSTQRQLKNVKTVCFYGV